MVKRKYFWNVQFRFDEGTVYSVWASTIKTAIDHAVAIINTKKGINKVYNSRSVISAVQVE